MYNNNFSQELNHGQKIILRKIETFDKISLFFHESPDFDTLGSCFAIMEFIKSNYSNKEVRIIGLNELPSEYLSTLFVNKDYDADDAFISKSLGIICDTARSQRVYSQKYKLCVETLRIDHHIEVENFATNEWIDPIYPATCQMVADTFIKSKMNISSECAKYLYAGIITDTGRFLHYNTNPETFYIAYVLVSTGFNREEVYSAVYKKTKTSMLFSSAIIKRIKVKKRVAYAILPLKIYKKYNINIQHSMVHVLSGIKDVDIWSTLYYDKNLKCWKGSLRSVNIPINHIAEKFNGGGHKFASGFKLNKKNDYKKVIKEIQNYLESLKK